MRNIKIAALQFSCCSQVQENIDKAETMVREAASNGANLILLPELFERPYFCQEKRYDYYDYALPLTENPAVRRFQAVEVLLQLVTDGAHRPDPRRRCRHQTGQQCQRKPFVPQKFPDLFHVRYSNPSWFRLIF